MDLDLALLKRRSCRQYIKNTVPRDLIEKLIYASSLAPVSCNLQLTQYVVVDDVDILNTLTNNVSYKFAYAPSCIVVLQDIRFLGERYSGIMSAGMAVENLLLKATDLGLATCSMAGFDGDNKIKKILNIPDHLKILLVISLGYCDDSVYTAQIQRLPTGQRFSFNNYEGLVTMNSSLNLDEHSIADVIDYRRRISPVYMDRFRLNSYRESYYVQFYDYLNEKVFIDYKKAKLIDLVSYDGVFIKEIFERDKKNRLDVYASDYLNNNLSFFEKQFGFKTVEISDKNKVITEEVFDIITFAFQLPFTPKIEDLLESVYSKMKDKSVFVVSVIHESWYKRLIIKMVNFYKVLFLRKKSNIYENNRFYKTGPVKYYTSKKIVKLFKENGLKIKSKYIKNLGKGNSLGIYIFIKS
jgi:nitroreductase